MNRYNKKYVEKEETERMKREWDEKRAKYRSWLTYDTVDYNKSTKRVAGEGQSVAGESYSVLEMGGSQKEATGASIVVGFTTIWLT